MNWSIERKLPLFVTTLLVVVAIVQLTTGYGEVLQASRSLADQRLRFVDSVLVELFQASPQRARITALAKDSAVVTFLRSGGRSGRAQALAALSRITLDTSSTARVELRDFSGRLLLSAGRVDVADRVLVSPGTDSARYGELFRRDTLLYSAMAAATPAASGASERSGGIVQYVTRLQLNDRSRRFLSGLTGGEMAFLFGNAAGDPWTDFASIVPPPPERVRNSPTAVRYERGESKRAIAKAIPGTPWMVATEIPTRLIIGPSRDYLFRMAPVAALIVVLGAVLAWWGSRRLTKPLVHVTRAAEAITAGDLEQRVSVQRNDELGRLARSFNLMAEQVSRSHHDLEAQVAQRTKALEGTNAELESFSYSVSHDLRAPLRAIHGFARILLEDHQTKLDPEAQRLLGVIDQNTRRMGQLIDDLLSFSRLGRKELASAPVDMTEMARVVADELRRAEPERNGQLEIRIDALRPAQGDRALLRQVLSNLLQNAMKFTRARPHAMIEVGSRPDGTETVYYVKDNGAGFDARYVDKLFGVFQRLHSAEEFEGTGVGLAIVKRIVQRHGGRVWAEGKVNEGATFYFSLPHGEN